MHGATIKKRYRVFTAQYALSPFIKDTLVFKGLKTKTILLVHFNVSHDKTAVNRNFTAETASIYWEFKSPFVSAVQVAYFAQQPRGTPNYWRVKPFYMTKRKYSVSRTTAVLYIKLQFVLRSENISTLL
jgi:hypothetical protein